MKCKSCNTKNDKDALFCKKCGASLVEEEIKEEKTGKKKDNKENKSNKSKTKTKTKTKVKNNTKKEIKHEKEKEVKVVKEKENSTGKNFLIFFLTVIIIGLVAILGCFGYKYYEENYNIQVPNFIGMTYEDAKDLAFERNLKVEKIEKESKDENINKVIKQSKKVKSKVKKNTTIKITVGIKDNSYKVEKFIDMEKDDAIEKINKLGIEYEIVYNEDYCDDEKVLNQKPLPGTKIDKKNDSITLLVCKELKDDHKDVENTEDEEDEEEVEDSTEDAE